MYLFHYSITHSICFLLSFKAKQIAALLEYLKQVLLPWMLLIVFGFTEESSSHSRCFGSKVSSRFGGKRSPKISNDSTEGSGSCSPELIQKLLWSLRSSRRVLDYRSVYHMRAWVSDVPQQSALNFTSVTPCPLSCLQFSQKNHPSFFPNFQMLQDCFSVLEEGDWGNVISDSPQEEVRTLELWGAKVMLSPRTCQHTDQVHELIDH